MLKLYHKKSPKENVCFFFYFERRDRKRRCIFILFGDDAQKHLNHLPCLCFVPRVFKTGTINEFSRPGWVCLGWLKPETSLQTQKWTEPTPSSRFRCFQKLLLVFLMITVISSAPGGYLDHKTPKKSALNVIRSGLTLQPSFFCFVLIVCFAAVTLVLLQVEDEGFLKPVTKDQGFFFSTYLVYINKICSSYHVRFGFCCALKRSQY